MTARVVVAGHVDHGKSTLIGRLVYDLGLLDDAKIADVLASSARRGTAPEWSYVLDALQEERDQAITIDTTRLWFSHRERRYALIDAPGHRQFLANMLSGASEADGALLVVDAVAGIGEQTRRHAYLLHFLGVRQIVVAVNKVDLLAEPKRRVAELRGELTALLDAPPIAVVPVSASNGLNVVERSAETPWYAGPSVLEALEVIRPAAAAIERPLRMVVQDVYRRDGTRIVAGHVASGTIASGDALLVQPSGERIVVERLLRWPDDVVGNAAAGETVGVVVSGDRFVGRGDVLVDPATPQVVAREIAVEMFWLALERPRTGETLRLKRGTQDVHSVVVAVDEVYDIEAGSTAGSEDGVQHNIVRLRLRAASAVAFDRRDDDAAGARSVLLREGDVVAIGFTVDAVRVNAENERTGVWLWLDGVDAADAEGIVAELRARGVGARVAPAATRLARSGTLSG